MRLWECSVCGAGWYDGKGMFKCRCGGGLNANI